jgi:hypothetical protein
MKKIFIITVCLIVGLVSCGQESGSLETLVSCVQEPGSLETILQKIEFSDHIILAIKLPDGFSVDATVITTDIMPDLLSPHESFAINNGDNAVGEITLVSMQDFFTDDACKAFLESKNPRSLYQELMTGMNHTWDIDYQAVYESENAHEGTSTSLVSYRSDMYDGNDLAHFGQPFLDEGDDSRNYYNKAVLGYNIDLMRYAAIEFNYDCVTDQQLKNIAESIRIMIKID